GALVRNMQLIFLMICLTKEAVMGQVNIEHFHTDPTHVQKIRMAVYGPRRSTFVRVFVAAFLLGAVLTYLAFQLATMIPQTSEVVYLNHGGLEGHIPLILFTLIMTI